MVRDPWSSTNPTARKRLFLASSVLLLGLSAVMLRLDLSLRTEAAPNGVVDYELAGTVERTASILDSWPQPAREAAMLLHGLDYLYLIVYPVWFSLACAGLARARGGRVGACGIAAAWLVLLAIPLDAVENRALIVQLFDGPHASAAALARACAVPKFAVVAIAAGYMIVAGLVLIVARGRSRRKDSSRTGAHG